ncbi:hypothetical protein, partial [Yanshouia hominis]|uniref:hypothetical protein n=1 Tax=Yanshouia hominis TaxID=2763673 RepID=UPI0021CCDCEC
HHLLERACVSFVWYSFPHNKAPHFLVQVYHTCLTNGVQFTAGRRTLPVYLIHQPILMGICLLIFGEM